MRSVWRVTISTISQCTTKARFPFKSNRLRWQVANHGCHCFGRAFLLAGACVCCVNASDCVRMETGLKPCLQILMSLATNVDILLIAVTSFTVCCTEMRSVISDCYTVCSSCSFIISNWY